MVALSRELTRARTPNPSMRSPHFATESVLSRKAKSELNLINLHHTSTSSNLSGAVDSELVSTPSIAVQVSSHVRELPSDLLECQAQVALKVLGCLARRIGLELSNFVDGLMALLTSAYP